MTNPREPRLALTRDLVTRQFMVLVGGVSVLVLPAALQVVYLMIALPMLWSMRSHPY